MSTRSPWLVVSVHDVAPASWVASQRWVDGLDELGIAATLLVIPGPWRGAALAGDAGFAAWLHACAAGGHEIALHGWEHRAEVGEGRTRRAVGSVVARGCEEFFGLDHDQAARRIGWGLDALGEVGFTPAGFVPPGLLASPAARDAMRDAGLRYTTSHTAAIDLVTGERHRAVALSHRPGSGLERLGAHAMSLSAGGFPRLGCGVRISLHPDDLGRPRLRDAAFAAITRALAGGCVARTYLELVAGRAVPA